MTHLLMPEAGLNKTSRTESIVTPCLNALTLSAHPVSKQIIVIGIGAVGVKEVGVENTRTIVGLRSTVFKAAGEIRITGLDSKIQFIEFGNLRQV